MEKIWWNTWTYNSNGKKLIKSIEPKFNRLIIFNTNDYSYHGITDKVNAIQKLTRENLLYCIFILKLKEKVRNKNIKTSQCTLKKNYKDHKNKLTRNYF